MTADRRGKQLVDLIRALGELRDEGLLTDAEFEEKKQEILRRL